MRPILTLAATLLLFAMTPMLLHADDPVVAPAPAAVENEAPAEQVELKTLRIIAGRASLCDETRCFAAVTVDRLPQEVAFVATEFEDATFASDGNTLVVGIAVEGKKPGDVLAEIKWRSDCPNNSVFGTSPPALAENRQTELREALVAWTRWRHDAKEAPLLRIVTSRTSFDVRLNLKLVSLR